MTQSVHRTRKLSEAESVTLAGGAATLLASYWLVTVAAEAVPWAVTVRAVLAVPLVGFVPGALVTALLGIRPRTLGRYSVYAVGMSVALLSVLVVGASLVLPPLGVARPLSAGNFGMLLTVVVALLTAAAVRDGIELPRAGPVEPFPVIVGVSLLPAVAAFAAGLMNRFGSNAGMWVLFLLLGTVTLLTTTRLVPQQVYPLTVFSVGLATLLHKNLLTATVVGADVQGLVAIAEQVMATGAWTADVSGLAVPAVTAVPAAVASFTGLDVHLTFKLVHVLLYAFVPVGVYYLGRDVFGYEAGLYGGLLLVFYHYTFSFTPGKQLISQLFVVTLLLALRANANGRIDGGRAAVAFALPSAGLIFAHYGTTFAVGGALLFAAIVVHLADRLVGPFDERLSLAVPVGLLAGAVVWYAFGSPSTLLRIASLPAVAADQITALLVGRSTAGSGASYVSSQREPLEVLNVLLYLAVTGLLVVGVGERALAAADDLRKGVAPVELGYTALAVPLLALLATSYVLPLNLWADRVYQLVLVVLAPFVPVGYAVLVDLVTPISDRVHDAVPRPTWGLIAGLLVALLLVNSGFAFALAGNASTSTFNSEANDLVFGAQERAGAEWLGVHANVTETSRTSGDATGRATVDDPGEVQIYTDPVSAQLFRSVTPTGYTTADLVLLRSRWQPQLNRSRIHEGYVYFRTPAIKSEKAGGAPLPTESISRTNVTAISTAGNVVYTNGVVTVVRVRNASE